MTEKFLLIDGSSLVHRAFYALPLSLTTASGFCTNAAYGFTNMLIRLLADHRPDYIAAAFDKGRVTFRTAVYAEYKGQRKATPPELAEQFPLVREIVTAFGIPMLEEEGYEADDIIGTLSAQAAAAGLEVLIVTGDRDAYQLIGPTTKVLMTKKGITEMEVVDEAALKEKYGIAPAQIIDMKGLMGDASDNIPGLPGVGEKTALKLLGEFGSVEELLAQADKVSGKKLQETVRLHGQSAVLSKHLATIVRDMPLTFSPVCYRAVPDMDHLKHLFEEYEFRSLLAKVAEIFPESAALVDVGEKSLPESQVLSAADRDSLRHEIQQVGTVAVYPFAVGTVPDMKILGAGIAVPGGTAGYIDAAEGGEAWLLELLTDDQVTKIAYSGKLLHHLILARSGQRCQVGFDAEVSAYLIDSTAAKYPLGDLVGRYLGRALGWEEKQEADKPGFAVWAAAALSELRPVMEQIMIDNGLYELYQTIELPLTGALAVMEATGVRVDPAKLREMSREVAGNVDKLLDEIYSLAGEQFNVNSTRQLGAILFERLKLPAQKKTKTGYSTDAEVLEKLAGYHPVIDCLLEYRMLTKLKSTYLDGLACLVHPRTGRIHTTFNQTVTATGRLSSSDPNLQNIPVRSEIGRKIRELFLPGDGYDVLVSADYSQIELRVLAHMSGDPVLIEAFRENQDVHTRTASEVFGVPMDKVTPMMRSRAKAVNFGIVYGISDYGLSRDIGVSRKEAGEYIDGYFHKYPGVKSYIDSLVARARQDGFVTTLFGRRRWLPDIRSGNFNQRSFAERTAMNTPIQGTAADIIKKAMLEVSQRLQEGGLHSRVLLQVHDELVLEVPMVELDVVTELVKSVMEQTVSLDVPMVVDVKKGRNWAEAK